MGLSRQQVINDVLDRFEAHLSFLQYTSERDDNSVVGPTLEPPAEKTVPAGETQAEASGDAENRDPSGNDSATPRE